MERSEKERIRKWHKECREKMDSLEVKEKSEMICKRFLKSNYYQDAKRIFGYYPLGNEVDCLPIIRKALLDGKQVALPRTDKDCHMDFFEIETLEQVTEGAFHVMEPEGNCSLVKPQETDVVIVPGVVFDQSGNRYGYGKGYYDRYFARFSGVTRIALSYENQLECKIEILDTDVKMHGIYTEQQSYLF